MNTNVIEIDQNHIVEVAIKRKIGANEKEGQKRTSPIANSISAQKSDKKRSTTSNIPWYDTFAEQSASYLKKDQAYKRCKMKDRKQFNAKEEQKNCNQHMNANLSKKISSQKKSEDHSKTLCCSSVLVQDRAVQHPEMCVKDKSAEFNPILTLRSLTKELKDLVGKDKEVCEICNKMEQELSKISANPESLLPEDFKIKLKDSKAQMEDSSEKIKNTWALLLVEREKLQSQIQEKKNYIKEVEQQYANLEIHAKRNSESSEREISDLKAELVKQTELARKNHNNNQRLTMERDKCAQLNNCKDALIKDYQNAIKTLQNQLANQLEIINEMQVKVQSAHSSTIHTGRACSSPTSSFSNRSSDSLHDLSDVSSVRREFIAAKEDAKLIRNSEHLDFVSLLDGELSHTILDPLQNQVANDERTAAQNNSKRTNRNLSTNGANERKSLLHSSEKDYNKENDVYKTKKALKSEEIRNTKKNLFHHEVSKVLEAIASDKIPVNVPSPVRDYPTPSWSESSLPTSIGLFSSASNLDMVSLKND